jgi:cytochrome P450
VTDVLEVDLTDPQLYTNGFPHDTFTALRERGPVHHHAAVEGRPGIPPIPFWSIVAHKEIQQANRDWKAFGAEGGPMIAADPLFAAAPLLVSMDPPDHTELRKTITSEFTPRMIGRLEQSMADRSRSILAEAATAGSCDFVQDIAYQIPMHVIADIVGIPESDRPWVFERTDHLLKSISPYQGYSEEDRLGFQVELFEYAQKLTAHKRAHPSDDVWTKLAGRLEGFELEMFFPLLAVAGSETTRNSLVMGLIALLDNPGQLDELRANRDLAATAADEAIRWSSPVLYFGRTATADVTFGGQDIKAGDRVLLWYPSGNRDASTFENPFQFDIHRSPNPHVSFGGGGVHYCLGANVARKEVQVVFDTIADAYDIELAGPAVWFNDGPVFNGGVGIESLPVRVTARS